MVITPATHLSISRWHDGSMKSTSKWTH